jgi:hypothetical protein
MKLSDEEQRVIEVLVQHPRTRDAYAAPIQSVSRSMGWDTAKTMMCVEDLIARGEISRRVGPFKAVKDGQRLELLDSWWERALE